MKQWPGGISRRKFLQTSSVIGGALALGAPEFSWGAAQPRPANTETELPQGTAPQPVALPHFPDRLHAFVWRNWQLVPAERMARVVGARTGDILRLGHAMGLDEPPRISREQQARSYLTVIRRNWHLLPYEQLLALLGWTREQLAYTLREDDFLFVKLGNLKPRCERLRYEAPDPQARARAAAMAQIVREAFPNGVSEPVEPLFGFVAQLSKGPAGAPVVLPASNLKFCYSYFALYGDPLLEPEADPYPPGYLARLAQAGVNGVWLQAVLYKLAPFPWEPERSARYEERLKNLRRLVARARQHGIRVFLYLNEPRSMPSSFFASRPQLRGAAEGDYAAMCTSQVEVQEYLVEAVASICRAVPDLGGFFSITASENLTNCWSHGGGAQCPRCGKRSAAAVIAEVNRLFADGIGKAGTPTQLLAWDWGWSDAWSAEAIRQLPPSATLMSVSEWQLPIARGGVKTEVGEYSISAVGPGPRARRHWQWARERGLKTVAKIQAGNTWELSAVPYIPAVENVARHAENLRQAGVSGFMLGWTLGGYPSPNLEVVGETLACGSADTALRRVAERRFGTVLAPAVVEAWRQCSAAFREFPFHGGVVYSSPQQVGPANLLWAEPTGYHASMVGFPYDDLDGWRAVYPAPVFSAQMERVAEGFGEALKSLKQAVAGLESAGTAAQRQALAGECRVMEAAEIHFRSVVHQARFVQARRALAAAKNEAERGAQLAAVEGLLKGEIDLACRLHRIQSVDSRIGFEASNQYYYVPVDLAEKVLNCRELLARYGQRAG